MRHKKIRATLVFMLLLVFFWLLWPSCKLFCLNSSHGLRRQLAEQRWLLVFNTSLSTKPVITTSISNITSKSKRPSISSGQTMANHSVAHSTLTASAFFPTITNHVSSVAVTSAAAAIRPTSQICIRDKLIGQIELTNKTFVPLKTLQEIAYANPGLEKGGRFRPSDCRPEAKGRIAVVIPYRNRNTHLRALLSHLHPILQRQQLDYQVFVVEQAGNGTFNKAVLMNAAFKEAQQLARLDKDFMFSCFVFHDVDMLLEDDRGIYGCFEKPLHLSEYLDKFNYEPFLGLRYAKNNDVLFGGVVSLQAKQFKAVNGYSNSFFGWGGEDEEMSIRLRLHGLKPVVPDREHYRFRMIKHPSDTHNPINSHRFYLMQLTFHRMAYDGLNSVKYQVVKLEKLPSHTWLLVQFSQGDIVDSVFRTMKMTG